MCSSVCIHNIMLCLSYFERNVMTHVTTFSLNKRRFQLLVSSLGVVGVHSVSLLFCAYSTVLFVSLGAMLVICSEGEVPPNYYYSTTAHQHIRTCSLQYSVGFLYNM